MASQKAYLKDATLRYMIDISLGAGPIKLFMALLLYADRKGRAYPSDRKLRSLTGASKQNHKRYRKQLEIVGLIKRYKGSHRSKDYQIMEEHLILPEYDDKKWKFYKEDASGQISEMWSYCSYERSTILNHILDHSWDRRDLYRYLILCQTGKTCNKKKYEKFGLRWRADRLARFQKKIQEDIGSFKQFSFYYHGKEALLAMKESGRRSGRIRQNKTENIGKNITLPQQNPPSSTTESPPSSTTESPLKKNKPLEQARKNKNKKEHDRPTGRAKSLRSPLRDLKIKFRSELKKTYDENKYLKAKRNKTNSLRKQI